MAAPEIKKDAPVGADPLGANENDAVARKEAQTRIFEQRAHQEVLTLVVQLLTHGPIEVKATRSGFVREVRVSRFREALEQRVPPDGETDRYSPRNHVLFTMGMAAEQTIEGSINQFDIISDGSIKIPSLEELRRSAEAYLKYAQSDAIDIGKYFERFAPFKRDLETSRLEADQLLNRLADLVSETPSLASEIKANSSFQKIFEAVSSSTGPLPVKAPELWEHRDAARGENAIGFLRRVYSPWLSLPEPITISDIRALDRGLYTALHGWHRRHEVPEELKAFFTPNQPHRSASEQKAELRKHRIRKPEDAYARFPDDKKTADRLYKSALRHL